MTALHWATYYAFTDAVTTLCELGADVLLEDIRYICMYLCLYLFMCVCVDAVTTLCELGADVCMYVYICMYVCMYVC
jgi:hypothetical protein